MAYVLITDVTGKIPNVFLTEALDDDGDGKADAGLFDQLVATASNDVNGYLAGLFDTPFADPAPAQVRASALIFVCEAVYARRLAPDQRNPYASQANWWRTRLQAIGERKIPLDSAAEGAVAAMAQGGSQIAVQGRIPIPTQPPPPGEPMNYP